MASVSLVGILLTTGDFVVPQDRLDQLKKAALDLYEAVLEKLEEIKKKYPVDQVKGKPHKYTYYTKK